MPLDENSTFDLGHDLARKRNQQGLLKITKRNCRCSRPKRRSSSEILSNIFDHRAETNAQPWDALPLTLPALPFWLP